jgi:hypothetical protein
MKPTFLVIGAPKAATTTICALMAEHPDVYLFPRKGTQFFNRRYELGWQWYESLFSEARDEIAIGEGSPGYAGGPKAPVVAARIASHLPEARLIYVARHPIKRLEAHYAQQFDNGREFSSLGEAVHKCPPLVEGSRYWARLNDFRQCFPDGQILCLFYEDFCADPQTTLRRCFEHVGVDPTFQVSNPTLAKNTRSDKRTDRSLLRWLRKRDWFLKLQWAAPQWVTTTVKPMLRRRIQTETKWDAASYRWVVDQLLEDSRQFLAFHGKPAEYWRFADAP